jgi:hypothetical protein
MRRNALPYLSVTLHTVHLIFNGHFDDILSSHNRHMTSRHVTWRHNWDPVLRKTWKLKCTNVSNVLTLLLRLITYVLCFPLVCRPNCWNLYFTDLRNFLILSYLYPLFIVYNKLSIYNKLYCYCVKVLVNQLTLIEMQLSSLIVINYLIN